MRILVDANIIISAGLYPESDVGKVLSHIMKNHKIILCKYTLDELLLVFKKKFPNRIKYFNDYISKIKYEYINIKIDDFSNYPSIRDNSDLPILANAIESKADILLTGDKDFDDIAIKSPLILKPGNYMKIYMS